MKRQHQFDLEWHWKVKVKVTQIFEWCEICTVYISLAGNILIWISSKITCTRIELSAAPAVFLVFAKSVWLSWVCISLDLNLSALILAIFENKHLLLYIDLQYAQCILICTIFAIWGTINFEYTLTLNSPILFNIYVITGSICTQSFMR